jgi:nitrate reductase gamma subunit
LLLSLIAYLSIFLFLGISGYKAYQFAKLPLHGRMELYPVPKEKGHEYGGSYYEEVEWWNKERQVSHRTELIEMLKEMLFIKKLFDHQKPLWWLSYALHLGIYFLIAWTILLVIGSLTLLGGGEVSISAGVWGSLIFYLTAFTGLLGLILATFGSGMLLLRRLFDDTLRKYTTPQEYFNLILLYSAVVTGIFVWIGDLGFYSAREITANLITFIPFQASGLFIIHLVILFIMFTYIPLSKMSHYVGKYFTFHKVLWENDPNLRGSEVEKKVEQATAYRPTNSWSAPHITGATPPNK